MDNPTIQTDIAEILKDLQKGQQDILKEMSDLRISLEGVKRDIKALEHKLKRVANQEFLNRGVFIGLLVALLGGVVNFFGWIPKS